MPIDYAMFCYSYYTSALFSNTNPIMIHHHRRWFLVELLIRDLGEISASRGNPSPFVLVLVISYIFSDYLFNLVLF